MKWSSGVERKLMIEKDFPWHIFVLEKVEKTKNGIKLTYAPFEWLSGGEK